ncbi:ribokinase [Histidinibacterium aquaticum]|uniref:Ribokinase n=1 Tax=Histidinibacterium aquaticum TaxID=2613962 RepID=A0A5J5GPP1_9RHOB|nr:ribokinase [Histidinibacterium aquaticum]KAA9010346.1 ribokinase [Histidinibacterium aquaticum]
MTILNIGSINWDRLYVVDHFPGPGETLAAKSASVGLGGKGLNQSVAIQRAGGRVRHVGAIGEADAAMRAAVEDLGLETSGIVGIPGSLTGSALIVVERGGENQIILDPGANARIPAEHCREQIVRLEAGDRVLLQNETNVLAEGAALARGQGVGVVLAAAPFDAALIWPVLPDIDLLAVNEIEFAQLREAGGELPNHLSILVTYGARGASLITPSETINVPAIRANPVDTTGAGDTTLGCFLARLDAGEPADLALRYAMAAAALQVQAPGAATAIPHESEVLALLDQNAH